MLYMIRKPRMPVENFNELRCICIYDAIRDGIWTVRMTLARMRKERELAHLVAW